MNINQIELEFADGVYWFALPLPRIDELQRKTGVGIGALFARVLQGCVKEPKTGELIFVPNAAAFYAVDLIETIRQGLIGGGRATVDGEDIEVTPALANRLIENYVSNRPLHESWSIACAVLGACIIGFNPPKKDEPPQKGAAPKRKKAASTTA